MPHFGHFLFGHFSLKRNWLLWLATEGGQEPAACPGEVPGRDIVSASGLAAGQPLRGLRQRFVLFIGLRRQ